MEIHFYDSLVDMMNHEFSKDRYYSWCDTEEAIKNKAPHIATLQMALMNTRLIEMGYRIFVHDKFGKFEITLESCERLERELKSEHNIFKLWENGAFCKLEDFNAKEN